MYYLRIKDGAFSFVIEGIHEIIKTDVQISEEEYNDFFKLQSQGKQFKLDNYFERNEFKIEDIKQNGSLFDYLEEYESKKVELVHEEGIEDAFIDLDFRVSKIELGV